MLGQRETPYAVKLWEVARALSEEKSDVWTIGELAQAMGGRVTPSMRKRVSQLVGAGVLFRLANKSAQGRWMFFYDIVPIVLPLFKEEDYK